jgi:hypothetical protein
MKRFLRTTLAAGLAVLIIPLFAGCDLFDPPPGETQIRAAMDDMNAAIAAVANPINAAVLAQVSSARTADGTVSASWTSQSDTATKPPAISSTLTYTFANFQGRTNLVNGNFAVFQRSAAEQVWFGTITFSGSKVRSIKYNDLVVTATSSTGTWTVNEYYTYDDATGQRVY